uniref:Uncharacterized protein n=1 Tax=Plectus sambesii TaxID=2011161 RepID=A0A914VJ24_9BILA
MSLRTVCAVLLLAFCLMHLNGQFGADAGCIDDIKQKVADLFSNAQVTANCTKFCNNDCKACGTRLYDRTCKDICIKSCKQQGGVKFCDPKKACCVEPIDYPGWNAHKCCV